jgi:hypothetical protein
MALASRSIGIDAAVALDPVVERDREAPGT